MKQILIISLIAFIFIFNGQAQINNIEKIVYSKDSIPTLIRFKTDNENLIPLSESKKIISRHLKLENSEELKSKKVFVDEIGYRHERFQHYYRGIKVEFSEYTVHSKNDIIHSISGKIQKIGQIKHNPVLSKEKALKHALEFLNAKKYMWEDVEMEEWLKVEKKDDSATFYPKGELVIWTDWKSQDAKLTYKFDIYAQEPHQNTYIYIDALTGEIIDEQQILKNTAANGTAATKYSGIRNITTDSFTGGFRLHDPSRGNGITTWDLNTSYQISRRVDFVDNDNNWSVTEWNNTQMDNVALDALHAAQKTYDYFTQSFINRNGWDGNGSVLNIYVHYGNGENNASWSPTYNYIILGDGDGVEFNPLADLDVVAHEYGHGISDDEVGLNTNGEPGAIDEGLSDIWAACVEDYANIPGNNI